MSYPLQHPFTCLLAGPSGSGKTTFVRHLLEEKNNLIIPAPQRVVWAYGAWQDGYKTMNHLVDEWVEGIPRMEDFDPQKNNLLILDDLMLEADERVTEFFTKGSHHRNTSIIHLTQNLFHKGKEHRTISLNAHYMVLFKNPRDAKQVTNLGKQMYPGNVKFLQEAFDDATKEPYGYLLIDLKQSTPDQYRVRTNIFGTTFVYVPRKI